MNEEEDGGGVDDRPGIPQKVLADLTKDIIEHLNRGYPFWKEKMLSGGGGVRNFELLTARTIIAYAGTLVLHEAASPWPKEAFVDWCDEIYDEVVSLEFPKAEPITSAPIDASSVEEYEQSVLLDLGYTPLAGEQIAAIHKICGVLENELDSLLNKCMDDLAEMKGDVGEKAAAVVSMRLALMGASLLMNGSALTREVIHSRFEGMCKEAFRVACYMQDANRKAN